MPTIVINMTSKPMDYMEKMPYRIRKLPIIRGREEYEWKIYDKIDPNNEPKTSTEVKRKSLATDEEVKIYDLLASANNAISTWMCVNERNKKRLADMELQVKQLEEALIQAHAQLAKQQKQIDGMSGMLKTQGIDIVNG